MPGSQDTGKIIVVLVIGVAMCVLTLLLVSTLAGLTYQSQEKAIQSIGTAGGTTIVNVTNTEPFTAQIPFFNPMGLWYTYANAPWDQSFVYPNGGLPDTNNYSLIFYDFLSQGNRAYGNFNLNHHGSDYTQTDFFINTSPVIAPGPSTFDEDFALYGDGTQPTGNSGNWYLYDSSNTSIAYVNKTSYPGGSINTFYINTPVAKANENFYMNQTLMAYRLYNISIDFNATSGWTQGNLTMYIGDPSTAHAHTLFHYIGGLKYFSLINDTHEEDLIILNNTWYTANFLLDIVNNTMNLNIYDTSTHTLIDTWTMAWDPWTDGNVSFHIFNNFIGGIHFTNYAIHGWNTMLLSNAFKVIPVGTGCLMVIDNVAVSDFDVTMWNATTSVSIYTSLPTGEYWHYYFVYHWDNSTIEATIRNVTGAWMGNAWIGMSAATPTLTTLMFGGISTFDCVNSVDNVTTRYSSTVVVPGDTDIKTAIETAAAGGIQGISTIGSYLPVIVLAIIIVLVIGLVFAMAGFRNGPRGNGPQGGNKNAL